MAIATTEDWLKKLNDSMMNELTKNREALPPGFNQQRFALNTITVVSEMLKEREKKEKLANLTFESMAVSLCKAAYLGLDYFNGECYAIPYSTELKFQTDYKGEIKMCKRFSKNPIKDIFAKVVREGDLFMEEVDGGKQNITFRPQPFSDKPIIGAFAVVSYVDGSMMYDTMSKNDIENVRNEYSKAKDSKAWRKSTGEMYKKTVLRRLCKLIDLDFDSVEQQKAYLAGGDVEFENGQPVYLDGREPEALPDKGNKVVDVFREPDATRVIKVTPKPKKQEQRVNQNEMKDDFAQFEQKYNDGQIKMGDDAGFMEEGYWSVSSRQELIDRLAEYENTGKEPKEILNFEDTARGMAEKLIEAKKELAEKKFILNMEKWEIMNADIKVKILGSEWSIKFGTSKTFEQLKNSDGYTDPSERIIIIDSMEEKKESDSVQDMSEYKKMILRHEILHAFLFESGLMHNSASTSSWATNEEMVDWFAIQSPKIFDLYSNLDLVPVNEYL